jgi:hypothetical protein
MWQAGLYGGGVAAQVAGGRLTLVSGNGWRMPARVRRFLHALHERPDRAVCGGVWLAGVQFCGGVFALAGLAIGNYDIFAYNISGEGYALTLEAVKWTTDIARATAVVRQDGVWVKNGAPERRYLGTIRLYGVAPPLTAWISALCGM